MAQVVLGNPCCRQAGDCDVEILPKAGGSYTAGSPGAKHGQFPRHTFHTGVHARHEAACQIMGVSEAAGTLHASERLVPTGHHREQYVCTLSRPPHTFSKVSQARDPVLVLWTGWPIRFRCLVGSCLWLPVQNTHWLPGGPHIGSQHLRGRSRKIVTSRPAWATW